MIFSFEDIGRFGQVIYVDNMNLQTAITEIYQNYSNFSFTAFPNPFNDKALFNSRDFKGPCEIILSDLSAKIFRRYYLQNPGNAFLIGTRSLPAPVYILEIVSGSNRSVSRIEKMQ